MIGRTLGAPVRIAVGRDGLNWHQRFAQALDAHSELGRLFQYDLVSLDGGDWAETIAGFDVVLWKPAFMGPQAAAHYKEKIYFMQHYLGKLTVPNFNTIWHFESKIAQSYLFSYLGLPTPATHVSFDYHDAKERLRAQTFPIVLKEAFGAGSDRVRLVKTLEDAERILKKRFASQLSDEARYKVGSRWRAALVGLRDGWLWAKLKDEMRDEEHFRYLYWQQFLPDNPRDLRITVIGDRFVTGFWRGNRPNDFRASGSGRFDVTTTLPPHIIEKCIGINRALDCDSMAYDILFTGDEFVIVEMSYAYLDRALEMRESYYRREEDGSLTEIRQRVWPQTLWVDWTIERIRRALAQAAPRERSSSPHLPAFT